jgi:molecular chaperone DnaK
MANGNRTIGRFHLDGIPPAARGVPQIEVTFDIDANGILHVGAKDKATGKEQSIRIEASSGLSKDEIEKMRKEAEANADADKQAREMVDKLNAADSLIFQTEKQLKEFGDKIPADKKKPIEDALGRLKDAHKAQDIVAEWRSDGRIEHRVPSRQQEMYAAATSPGQRRCPAEYRQHRYR